MTVTIQDRSRRGMSPLSIIILVFVLPILSTVAFVSYMQTREPAPSIYQQFIPDSGYETYELGTGPGVDPGISFGDSRCRFNFGITRLNEAEFVNASVDGPAENCTVQMSVDYGNGFEPWKTATGDEPLGVTAFKEEAPYAVAVAYRLVFDDAGDGWTSGEEIVLQQEGGPTHLTPVDVSDDD